MTTTMKFSIISDIIYVYYYYIDVYNTSIYMYIDVLYTSI